jgi:hypothetical protein
MLRWLADENFNNDILRALFRRKPGIDVVRAQDVGLTGIDDEALLALLSQNRRSRSHGAGFTPGSDASGLLDERSVGIQRSSSKRWTHLRW